MYICSCNPFSDKKVKDYIDQAGDKKIQMSEVYRHCSGGEKPQCCSCLPELKEMVLKHNNAVTIKNMKDGLHGAPAPKSADNPAPAPTTKPNQPVI